jgi:Flp pilus assembly protein TadB
MNYDRPPPRLGDYRRENRSDVAGWLGRVLGVALGVAAVVAAAALSLILLAAILVTGVAVFAYLWWKTRGLRRQMRSGGSDPHIIEGEAVREVDPDDTPRT